MDKNSSKDGRERLALWQRPNLALAGWFILTIINHFADSSKVSWLATALIFTWAYMELFQGVNWFRRVLGLLVIVMTVYGRLK